MRIRKLQLAGLAVAVIGVGAAPATAEDVTITTATTQPLTTADPLPNPPAGPGSITINNGGSIAVTAGQTAITMNAADEDVINNGAISSNNADNTTAILLSDGFSGDITGSGTISLLEDHTMADDDSDGDLDDPFAIGTNRHGILQQSGTFTGNINTTGAFTIEGENSAGVRLNGQLVGDVTMESSFTIAGDNSHAFILGGGAGAGVTGDVFLRGSAQVRGEDSSGITIGAPIGGQLRVNGSWSVTGFHSTLRPADTGDLDPDDLLLSSSALAVHYSVADGVVIEGIGVEDDDDDDDDGIDDSGDDADANDNRSADLHVFGSAPAVWIAADPSANLLLGPTESGYGFHNRGGITATGVYDGIAATALRIEGQGGATVTVASGLLNDGRLLAQAIEADGYALYVGDDTLVPQIINRNSINSAVGSEGADTAYGVYIGANGDVNSFQNSGRITAQLFGEVGGATALIDESGTLANITNSGSIRAIVTPTDEDPNDDVVPPATGPTVAIDVSANTTGVTLQQIADTPFNDDDTTDDDVNVRPAVEIVGDILLGSGVDTVNLFAGAIQGDLSFGAGGDVFNIDNGATYAGRVTDSDGALTINVIDGLLDLRGGATNITAATFNPDGRLSVLLSEDPLESTLVTASGQVTFAPGSSIGLIVPDGLPVSDTVTFLTANGGLNGAANVIGPVSGAGTSFLYDFAIDVVDGDPNSLEASYQIKTAAQLGLNTNQSAALEPILEAVRQDAVAAAALAGIDNETDFFDAYLDLVPSFSSAATELAATAIQQMQSATTNRLSATRLHDLDEVSVWAQEIAYGLNREPATIQGQEFRGHGFGMAIGIDGPLNNGGLFGLSASFITSEVEEPQRPEGEIATTFGQANAYLGTAMGPIDLDFVGGVGVGRMSSERFVEIGDTFNEVTEADWWAYEAHGAIRASAPMRLSDWMIVSPQAQLTYVFLGEEGYTEEGGGAAVDYEADGTTSQRLWGDIGLEFSGRLRMRGQTVIAPRLYAGWRANLLDEESERTFRFVSGTQEFALVDEGYGDGGPLVGIGIDATNGYSTFTLGYEGEFGDQIERHSLNASIRFRF